MSIKKIAEEVGVSPATVSRVLNNPNYRCATPGLRDKIWKAAIAMNYVPNEAARNLKMGAAAKTDRTLRSCYGTAPDDKNGYRSFRSFFYRTFACD